MGAGSYVALSFLFIALAIVVLLLLDYFGNRKTQHWYTFAFCFIGFFFPFSVILVLPIDLASTEYDLCTAAGTRNCPKPFIMVSKEFLLTFWTIVYWVNFNFPMFIGPIMQMYVRSGAFTFLGKLWYGIKTNLVFYAVAGLVGVILILYAVIFLSIPSSWIISLSIPAANSYGLLLLVMFLGYGLVEIPRRLWYNSNVHWVLKKLEAEVPHLKDALIDSESEAFEVGRLVATASKTIDPTDPLRKYLDKILEKCPLSMDTRADDTYIEFNYKALQKLNARIERVVFENERDQVLLKNLYKEAFLCQDIITNMNNPTKRFESAFVKVSEPYRDLKLRWLWWWYIWIKPILMKVGAVLCVIASALVIWSESTFQYGSSYLSIPQLLLKGNNDGLEIIAQCFICYMCAATYSAIFSFKIFDFYRVVPNHYTDEATLFFVSNYLCKLTFPLCYNFLNMAGMADASGSKDGKVDYSTRPVFIQYLGPAVNLTPLLGSGYNDWLPYMVLITSIIMLLNLHGVVLKALGISTVTWDDLKATSDTSEGRDIIISARGLEERKANRESNPYVPKARTAKDLLDRYKRGETNVGSSSSSSTQKTKRGGFVSLPSDESPVEETAERAELFSRKKKNPK